MKRSPEFHNNIFFFGLALIVIGLPFSHFLISMGQMILAGNWLWEGKLLEKWNRFRKNKGAVLISSIFLLHVLGLLYTSDFGYAMDDLRIKLPLLILPLIISSSTPLNKDRFNLLMFIFIAAVVVGTFVSTYLFFNLSGEGVSNTRDISIFISHIRFALLICIAIYALLYYAFKPGQHIQMRITQFALACWLMLFILILKSMTGLIILFITGYFLIAYLAWQQRSRWIKFAALIPLVAIPIFASTYIYSQVENFYKNEAVDYAKLEKFTPRGEAYRHHKKNNQLENGNNIWTYVAWKELESTWNQRSTFPFWGKDRKSQPLHSTLIRFLASKGLRKDADGVAALSEKDVKSVEEGIANYRFVNSNNIETRIYQIIWEFDNYSKGMNPQGNSVTQRLEFWKAALGIIKRHPILGVGTGDVKVEFANQYELMKSMLSPKYRLRAHNQYLSIAVALGIVGAIWFLIAVFGPVILMRKTADYFYMTFLLIACFSMLNEDTLETQVGVTLFTFFNCLFLFGREEKRLGSP